jgi:hypothetical protein
MENKYMIGIIAIAIVLVLAVGTVSAYNLGMFSGFGKNQMTDQERAQSQEQEKAVNTAIANNDYAGWKSLMEQEISQMQAQITQDNFNSLVAQHQERSAAQQDQEAVKTAIANNDYSSWKSLMESRLTQDNFNTLVTRFQKMESIKKTDGSSSAPKLSETQKAIQTAIQNNDYSSWKSLMESQITSDNFNTLVNRYSQIEQNQDSSNHQGRGRMDMGLGLMN